RSWCAATPASATWPRPMGRRRCCCSGRSRLTRGGRRVTGRSTSRCGRAGSVTRSPTRRTRACCGCRTPTCCTRRVASSPAGPLRSPRRPNPWRNGFSRESPWRRNTVMGSCRVTVVGAGYVGLTSATCLARLGHRVVCVDNDTAKVASLCEGRVPFYEPDLDKLLREGLASERLRVTTALPEAVRDADLVLLCVPTP